MGPLQQALFERLFPAIALQLRAGHYLISGEREPFYGALDDLLDFRREGLELDAVVLKETAHLLWGGQLTIVKNGHEGSTQDETNGLADVIAQGCVRVVFRGHVMAPSELLQMVAKYQGVLL